MNGLIYEQFGILMIMMVLVEDQPKGLEQTAHRSRPKFDYD